MARLEDDRDEGVPAPEDAHLQAVIDLFEVADVKQKAVKKGAKRPTAVS
jgi:hypothetical protein